MNKQPSICVVGSINIDFTTITDKVPAKGETLLGKKFFQNPGGKGANQAVAAARMGADVDFIGAVGQDQFGRELCSHLRNEGVKTDGMIELAGETTGFANVILSEQDNRIIVVPGANNCLSSDHVEKNRSRIEQSDVVLLQLEIPMETIAHTVKVAKEAGVPVILNPAPFQVLSENVINHVTYLTPNEGEAASMKSNRHGIQFEEKLVTTKGSEGVSFMEDSVLQHIPAHQVDVVDTTGAGDTFNGALATMIATGASLRQAVTIANAAAALSTMSTGAQTGMPTKQEVLRFLEKGELTS